MYHKSIHSMNIIVKESFKFPVIARVCIITVVQKSGLCIYTVKVLGSILANNISCQLQVNHTDLFSHNLHTCIHTYIHTHIYIHTIL